MGFPASPLYKDRTLCMSHELWWSKTVHFGYPSSSTVQWQYIMAISAALLYKESTLWVYQQTYCTRKGCTLCVSQQTCCTKGVPYWYSSFSIVEQEYPTGIPTILLYKDSTLLYIYSVLWVSQQLYCTRTPYRYPSIPIVQFHLDMTEILLKTR